MTPVPVHFSAKSLRTADQPISYFMQQAVENPHLISLAAGLVDPESLPAAEVAEAAASILKQPATAQAALQYGTTQGYAPLRERLLTRTAALDGLSPHDLALTPDDVVVTTGSEQLLYLLSEMLLDPGDLVITEAPSYFVYQGTLCSMGVRTLAVPMDEEGMRTDLLADLLARLERNGELDRLRLIYLCDYFQNPSGLTLSLPRRQHLLELARRYSRRQRILILEDAAYRELRYQGTDLPSLKSLDHDNTQVILAMTFSKPWSPGFKTGYGLLPRDLVGPLLRLKGNHDFGSNNFTQHLLDALVAGGAYDRHVAELRRVYRAKRDALLEALEREFRFWPEVRWTHPEGGLYVWLTFPPEVDTGPHSSLMRLALREGVLYVPGQFCYLNGPGGPVPHHEARLSFGVVPLDQIGEAVHRLARAAAALNHPGPPPAELLQPA
ncbi:MAG: PLP-dependent aminotransferase family protein, partial [Planctomycetes bacterium]|nr:PLP-dependent aminotransferase family protein [Planctomycetota bacterium]